uniref:Asl1-like glycosyl hydrolase catalytic domain-containing protein n=1 Tax=Kwoniella dejecticola CBS 10117 TaxID=1296121 RepID=A0A1A6A0T4_9TREE|nr:uncharacterized protein I303_05944 [Kwoniella dejecticola CBS 10117]OBR83664.1 hypothetical protein I303_05944 [Kwoniella dejecticola CBS 10117]
MVLGVQLDLIGITLTSLIVLPPALALNDNLTGPGLAWPNQLWVPMGGFTSPGTTISSYYTWGPDPIIPPKNSSRIWDIPFPFVPMLWGCNDTYIRPFQSALWNNFSDVPLTPKKDILGFNEPDHPGQALCSPQQAAIVWREVLEPLRYQGYRVGSPAVTSGEAGRQWMRDWYAACQGACNPDFLALHWYDLVPQSFIEHIQYYHKTYKLPVWITEYAPQNFSVYNSQTGQYDGQATYIEVQRFMDITTAYMKSVDWVERWFWFGAMYEMQGVNELDCLFDQGGRHNRTGALNELGVQYAGSNGSVTAIHSVSSAQRVISRFNASPL